MIQRRKPRLLAIDPGTRHFGIAVFEHGELIYYGVKTIKNRTSPHQTLKEGRRLVMNLLDDFRPRTLVIERAFFSNNRNAALLDVFIDETVALAERNGLQIVRLAPSTVKKAICGNGNAKKHEVARVVVSRFPELKVFIGQDRKWKDRYHSNMFDAVAIGLTALD